MHEYGDELAESLDDGGWRLGDEAYEDGSEGGASSLTQQESGAVDAATRRGWEGR